MLVWLTASRYIFGTCMNKDHLFFSPIDNFYICANVFYFNLELWICYFQCWKSILIMCNSRSLLCCICNITNRNTMLRMKQRQASYFWKHISELFELNLSWHLIHEWIKNIKFFRNGQLTLVLHSGLLPMSTAAPSTWTGPCCKTSATTEGRRRQESACAINVCLASNVCFLG